VIFQFLPCINSVESFSSCRIGRRCLTFNSSLKGESQRRRPNFSDIEMSEKAHHPLEDSIAATDLDIFPDLVDLFRPAARW